MGRPVGATVGVVGGQVFLGRKPCGASDFPPDPQALGRRERGERPKEKGVKEGGDEKEKEKALGSGEGQSPGAEPGSGGLVRPSAPRSQCTATPSARRRPVHSRT